MEENTEKLVQQIKDNTQRMKHIGEAAKATIETVLNNEERLIEAGGMEEMCRRHMIMSKEQPELHDALSYEYTAEVKVTMEHVADLYRLLESMIQAFLRIPDDKKKFARNLN